jgi:hypothetical protein
MSGQTNIVRGANNIPSRPKVSGERQKTFTTGVEDGSNDAAPNQRNYTEFNPLRSNE